MNRALFYTLHLLVMFVLFGMEISYGQSTSINPASVNVSALSDEQIGKIVQQMDQNGMSMEQAIAMARVKGASQTQIDQMVQRINAYRQGNVASSSTKATLSGDLSSDVSQVVYSERRVYTPSSTNEKIFGFNFFNSENLTFTPNVDVPVSNSYTLGIGDEIVIEVYGASQQSYRLLIEKDGCVHIPDLGPVNIYGKAFESAKKEIQKRLIAIYNGMQGDHPNTFASVNVGALRGVSVNVIGDVNMPGTYELPATATVFNALYLAGGPNEKGTFRNIKVLRDGKELVIVDVYKYLIDGKTLSNVQLRDQDVILVSPYLNRITISGEFKRTGIFEAKDNEKMSDIIRYAGGFSDKAYTNRLDLYRNNSRTKTFISVEKQDYHEQLLLNGDSIVAGEIVDRFENRVSIEGAVYRPGNYQLKEGMKLTDLIREAEGLKEEAFLERGIISRKKVDLSLATISFSLQDVMNGEIDYDLQKEDQVQISSIFDIREERTVEILGQVQTPGKYQWGENLKVGDLIFMAGGFKENAEVSNIEVSRVLDYEEISELSNNLLHTYKYGIGRNLKVKADDESFFLLPFDKVYVRRAPGYRSQKTVHIEGEIKYAGDYGITHKKEKISDIIKRAGGLTPEAYVKGASLRREMKLSDAEYQAKLALASRDSSIHVDEVKKVMYQIVGIDLVKAMTQPGCNEDLQVLGNDRIFIPSQLETVAVSGAVLNPVALTYTKHMNLKDYVRMSGGFSDMAKRKKTYVVYANGTSQATRGGIFGKKYPKIEPGCEIMVPEKPKVDKAAMASKWMAFTSAFASLITAIAVATR